MVYIFIYNSKVYEIICKYVVKSIKDAIVVHFYLPSLPLYCLLLIYILFIVHFLQMYMHNGSFFSSTKVAETVAVIFNFYFFVLGPVPSVLEYLSEKDRERLKEAKQASEQQMKAKSLPQQPRNSRFQPASPADASHKWQMLLGGQLADAGSSDFKPFAKNPEKQKRYENFVKSLKQGEKGNRLILTF